MTANHILVVDDEVGIRELLFEILRDEGYGVRLAENAQSARQLRREIRPDLVLLDIWMPDTDGITLLREWASSGLLTMPVVMMSGHGTIDSAVEATRIGAFDFLEKPISLPKLLATVGKALAGGRAMPRAGLTLAQLGKSKVIQELRQRLDQVARIRTPVLLAGERGCGFELAARHLHAPNTPWVAPEDSDWLSANPFGPLNEAREGTIFVSEIGALDRAGQKGLSQLVAKLEKFNARLVCSSAEPLAAMVADGRFDADLFHQVSGLTIRVPSLGEHPEDIPDLASQMLMLMVDAHGRVAWRSPQAQAWLAEWLGESADDTAWLRAGTEACELRAASGRVLVARRLGDVDLGETMWLLRVRVAGETPAGRIAMAALTPRETEVLSWIAKGKTNRDVGEILGMSPRTVNKHLEHVFEKLGVETRAAAAALASRVLE